MMDGRRETHNKTDCQDQQDGEVELSVDALVERLLLVISREVVSNVLLHRLLFLEVLKLGGFTGHRRLVDFVRSSHRPSEVVGMTGVEPGILDRGRGFV